jgi:hypothetical protein
VASPGVKSLERGIRLDLLIAVCALLISSLAMAASWLQSRETARQTQVLEEQLGAQVWPYLSVSETLDGDTASFSIENDGLGPAVFRSLSVTVDGKPKSNVVDVLHTILGSRLAARKPRNEHMKFNIDYASVGGVLRPGQTSELLGFTSKTFAAPLFYADKRITIATCYCAIVPGRCWHGSTSDPPQPVDSCPEIPSDLLHTSAYPNLRLL